MSINSNIIQFPNKLKQLQEDKKKKILRIRDEIEKILFNYSRYYDDEWADILPAGRFSSMRLQQLEGSKKCTEFFLECIKTQENNRISQ